MASENEQKVYKILAKVLNYKRVQMTELTTKRASQMLYRELKKENFVIQGKAEPEWSFIPIFQVMFHDQNHMPDYIKVDPQLVLDVLAYFFREKIRIVKDGTNYCELAVIKGGEAVTYPDPKRPKTLKISLFKLFSPGLYNQSSPDEIASIILEKAFPKINYDFQPKEQADEGVRATLKDLKKWLPELTDYKDLIEVADGFLRLLARRGIKIVKTG